MKYLGESFGRPVPPTMHIKCGDVMNIKDMLELKGPKFEVMLKGLLHTYKPAKNAAIATNTLNLLIVGTTEDSARAYVQNILRTDCPTNILCIGADSMSLSGSLSIADTYKVSGFVVFLPELAWVRPNALVYALHTARSTLRSSGFESVDLICGADVRDALLNADYEEWIDHRNYNVFKDSDTLGRVKGTGAKVTIDTDSLYFTRELFLKYTRQFIMSPQGRVNWDRAGAPFPYIKADRVLFERDIELFTDDEIQSMLFLCQHTNPNVAQVVTPQIARRMYYRSLKGHPEIAYCDGDNDSKPQRETLYSPSHLKELPGARDAGPAGQ